MNRLLMFLSTNHTIAWQQNNVSLIENDLIDWSHPFQSRYVTPRFNFFLKIILYSIEVVLHFNGSYI